jgi:2-phospho-L-lactate guanylyltransferase
MFTIIPIKPFAQAKTRLTPILSSGERSLLSYRLLQRTIDLARQVSEVVVISRDAAARRAAKEAGAWALVESEPELNTALRQAAGWVIARGGRTVLILPGDLPLLKLSDLTGLIEAGGPGPTAVIAPSRRLDGTNALLLRPPGLIPFSFGPDSFNKHCQAALGAGIEPVVYRSDTLAFDLDLPEDLVDWQAHGCKVSSLEECYGENSQTR